MVSPLDLRESGDPAVVSASLLLLGYPKSLLTAFLLARCRHRCCTAALVGLLDSVVAGDGDDDLMVDSLGPWLLLLVFLLLRFFFLWW